MLRKLPCIFPSLSRKHASVLGVPPSFPSAALTRAEASTGLLKVLVRKNLKMKLTEQWNSQRAGPSSLFSSAPEEPGTPLGMQEVLGNQVSKNSPDPHWSQPLLCEIGQEPGEITAFPNHILLKCQNQLRPCLESLYWGQVLPRPGPSLGGPRQGKSFMSLAR